MRRLERAGLVAATAATAAGLIAIGACAKQVSGTAQVNQTDLASYTSEVAAAAERATGIACDAFRTANSSSVRSFNAYIEVSNTKPNSDPEVNTKANDAVITLRNNAKAIDGKVTSAVLSAVATPLRSYRDDTNALAAALDQRVATDPLNAAVDTFNATKDLAQAACENH